ncbi:MAG TPA: type IV pilus assembly protein PilM [Solirubrobacterales bacterium]|nr:type IV pilus assembly protein PilM [Solirubrobacterales bacterium]
MLSSKKKTISLVGVDIDTDSIAAADVAGADGLRAAKVQLAPGAYEGGEIVDVDSVGEALRELFSREKLSKRVRLAVASQGVAFRVVRLPLIEDPDQLKAAVRFQAQESIPMPLDSAVLDHQVIGAQVDDDGTRQVDVAVVAARRQTIENLLRAARGAGLDPVGIDLAAFGMIRALAGGSSRPMAEAVPGEGQPFVPATLYCSLGGVTNLAIARNYSCLFSRVAQFGARDTAVALAGDTGLSVEDAESWLLYVGVGRPLEELEGDPATAAAARGALESSVGRLADELRLSLDYYGAQEGATPVDEIVLTGWGSAIPGLAGELGAQLSRQVTVRRPDALVAMSDPEAARMTVPFGLALEQ